MMQKEKVYKNFISITKIFIFGCIFVYIFTYLTYLMKPKDLIKNMIGYYGEAENTLDMVYIGGSACHENWMPLQAFNKYGYTSYNNCYSAVVAESYKYLVKESLKTQTPKLFVIDARAFQYRETRYPTEAHYRGTITGMDFSKNKLDFINENVNKTLGVGRLSFIFDLIKYHRSFFSNINEDAYKMMYHKYKNVDKGFRFVYNTKILKRNNFQTNQQERIATESEKILLDFIDYIKTTNINYLFVVSPYQETQNDKKQFNYIENIVVNNGYDFLDANEYYDEMNLDFNNNFYDLDHVNIYGAEKYTNFLSDYIKQKYKLEDHRKDKNYKEWLDLSQNWNLKVNDAKKYTKNLKNKN